MFAAEVGKITTKRLPGIRIRRNIFF